MGGDRRLLPAAARPARRRRPADAVAHAGPVRSAGGRWAGPSALASSRKASAAKPTRRTSPACAPAATRRSRASSSARGATTCAPWRACAGAAATCWDRSPDTRSGPLLPPTRSCRCSPPTRACGCSCAAASQLTAGASATAGAAASGCRSARMRRHWRERWRTPASRAVCVELTNRFGLGAAEHLRPIVTESGVLLVPIDRSTISLVWSEQGYPASGAISRLSPSHHPPSQPVEQRRSRVRPRSRAGPRT